MPQQVMPILHQAQSLVGPALRAAVRGLAPAMRQIVAYQLGWHDQTGHPVAERNSGKAVRAALALACCEAAGAGRERAVPAAVAVELVHNASLLHDDLLDGDQMRRGRPAVWSAFGISAALLAGDALFFLAVRVMVDPFATIGLAGPGGGLGGGMAAGPGVVCLADTVRELIEGEYADMVLERRAQISVGESQAVAAGKTAVLIAASCALGAMAAGAAGQVVERMRGFGHHVGVAFQYVDDLLGIWGDPAATGKPARSDLATRKKSLPVAYALASGTPAGADLAALYAAAPGPLAGGHLERAAELVERAGGRAWAIAQADQHITAALDHLAAMRTLTGRRGEAVADLATLANLITHRDR